MKPWVRIQRLVRDIPTNGIEIGYNKITNLRQIINNQIKKEKLQCNDIRFKEIKNQFFPENKRRVVVRKYNASKGLEYHISIEAYTNNNIFYRLHQIYQFIVWFFTNKYIYYSGNNKYYKAVYGFCRLRIDPDCGGDIIPEINNSSIIREVHVYGNSSSINSLEKETSQHKGYGKLMISIAENITKNHNLNKITVISGIGTREYYRKKCNYYLPYKGTYMHKYLHFNKIKYIYRLLNFIIFVNFLIWFI